MNRFLRLIGLASAVVLVIAACGGTASTTTTAAGGGDTTTTAGPGDTQCALDQVDGDLNFYNWSEYIDPELIAAFETQYGVNVTEDFYESNEAMLAQLQAGANYDLIVPSDYMIGIMIEEGLLEPLHKDAVPNLANLGERFRSLPYDPGPEYSAAYQYGTTGLGVNLSIAGEDFDPSWGLLFDVDVTSQFGLGVSALNDPRETMGAALKFLGYSLNDTNIEHLQEAADLIAEAKVNIATFDSDQYDEALVNGEVAVAHGYSGNMIVAILGSDDPDNYRYILPKEGATLWIDNMTVPVNAENKCTAFTFMNFLLDAENGAALTNWNYYGSPNQAAIDSGLIDQEVIDFYAATEAAGGLEVIEDTGDYEINFTDYLAIAKS